MMQQPLISPQAPQGGTPVDIMYRFEVEEAETGLRYYVLVGDDGMAYREVIEDSLRKAG